MLENSNFIYTVILQNVTMASSQPLVLEEFTLDKSGSSKIILNVSCRNPGIMSWMANRMGLDPNSSVEVTKGSISFRSTSGSGFESVSSPLNSVAAFVGGFKKPIGYLYASSFFFCLCIISIFYQTFGSKNLYDGTLEFALIYPGEMVIIASISAIFCLICLISYFVSKSMYIGFETSGGEKHILFFKGDVDIVEIAEAISTVTDLMGLDKPSISQQSTVPLTRRNTAPPSTTFGAKPPTF